MNPNNNNNNNNNQRIPAPSGFSISFEVNSNGRVMSFGNMGPPSHFRMGSSNNAIPIFPHFESPSSVSSSGFPSSNPFMNQHLSPLFNLLNPNVHANNPFAAMLQQAMLQAAHGSSSFSTTTTGTDASFDAFAAHLFSQQANSSTERPTASSVLDSLKEVTINDEHIKEKKACAVCMTDFTKNEQGVVELPCPGHHCFHKTDCLMPWLTKHNTCPVCRFELKSQAGEQTENSPFTSSSTDTTSRTTPGIARRRRSFMDVFRGVNDQQPTVQTIDHDNNNYTNTGYTNTGTNYRMRGTNDDNNEVDSDNEVMGYIADMLGMGGSNVFPPHRSRRNQNLAVDTYNLSTTNNDFDEAELQAAMQASLADSSMTSTDILSSNTPVNPVTTTTTNNNNNNNNYNNNTADEDEYGQVLLSSLWCLSDTELQVQCADSQIDINPERSTDREYLIERLANHNGVRYYSISPPLHPPPTTSTDYSTFTSSVKSMNPNTNNNIPNKNTDYNYQLSSFSSEPVIQFTDIVHVPLEPSQTDPDASSIRVRLPDGTYISRRFDKRDTVSQIAAWIMSLPDKQKLFTINPTDKSPCIRFRLPSIPSSSAAAASSSITTSNYSSSSSTTEGINNNIDSTKALTVFDSSSWFIEIERTSFGKRITLIAEAY